MNENVRTCGFCCALVRFALSKSLMFRWLIPWSVLNQFLTIFRVRFTPYLSLRV